MKSSMRLPRRINKRKLNSFIKSGIKEDVQDGDHTSRACIPDQQISKAKLLVKDDGVIAGVEIARQIFLYLDPDCTIDVLIPDGETVKYGDVAFYLTCNSQSLLIGERLALNTMQRLSGVASMSRLFFNKAQKFNLQVLDTRKTTPLLRFLEKWAVALGGCSNYRDGLYDRIMIKDNHIEASGSITGAVNKVRAYLKENKKKLEITVEVRNLKELHEVLSLNFKVRVMLDNFSPNELAEAVKVVNHRLETEASGGINLTNFDEMAQSGVDYISIGALTHSAPSLDMSLKIIK